jgi:hypothetical protein
MRWTTDAPTEPGLYWLHEPRFNPTVVDVMENVAYDLVAVWPGVEDERPISSFSGSRWYGPITPPGDE